MNAETVEKRNLELADLDEIISEARRLQTAGYEKTGEWDLAQICGHLEDWIRFPVEGFPNQGFLIRFMLWTLKITIGKSSFRKILSEKSMGKKTPTMPQTVKSAGTTTEDEAIASLEQAVIQFAEHEGEYHDSPVFGKMTRQEAKQLQLIHAAHHFGFLIPNADPLETQTR